ncbi:CGEA protein [Bacillus toyonensis]|uniref:CGEA protein n=1 Tax=Bacillus toyonensis TaxID=155322 RepID=UPI000BEFA730|nr:CGEA protein [Bacillus toyonensis]MDF9450815.1 CGEA protein [Bacillus toyonensis]MDG1563913.1 CGEA protein [Bacillus toyonensis]PEO63089.1 CGEA protein [Bacillus toyonensis]PFX72522.1 CGEA protein [Bacillus toyonensis]PFX75950.1 CGEA protein [Bacillus toyonensis]
MFLCNLFRCSGGICSIFKNLQPGEVVTVTGKSGNIIGPAIFKNFNPNTCIVTLEEENSVTPPTTSITKISCKEIESVTFIS